MPRRKAFRHCIRFRGSEIHKPAGIPLSDLEMVELERDELEAMRLCDVEGLSQEQAGELMGVSRGTVQRLVTSGRAKLVGSILRGAAVRIVPTRNIGEGFEPGAGRRGRGGGRGGGRGRGRGRGFGHGGQI